MISTQFATKLFAVILLGQVFAAPAPDPQDSGGGGAPPRNFLDSTGFATIDDIQRAMEVATSEKNAGVNNWLPILLGFQKSNDLWASTMFQQRDSREQATVRLFDKDKSRQEEVVKLDAMDRTLKLIPDFKAEKDDPWWTWALLEASQARAPDPAVLDIPQTIQTLSGVEAVILEGDELKERLKDRKKLFDEIYSKIYYSPVWAKYKESDNYGVAVKLFDKDNAGPDSGIEFFDFPDRFSEKATEEDKKWTGVRHFKPSLAIFEPESLIYLKDFPKFENTTGEWVKA